MKFPLPIVKRRLKIPLYSLQILRISYRISVMIELWFGCGMELSRRDQWLPGRILCDMQKLLNNLSAD